MKFGVITDSVSADFALACKLASKAGLSHVELQSVWGAPVGNMSPDQISDITRITSDLNLKVSCLSHSRLFGGAPVGTTLVDDEWYQNQMSALNRVIDIARRLETSLVRIMCFRKETVLFGDFGAEKAVVAKDAWNRFVELMTPPVRLAEREGINLVVETSTKGMVTSGYLGRKLVDDIGSPALKVLWDPANTLYFGDTPYPDAYEDLESCLGHVHFKDAIADPARARIDFAPFGTGQMAPYLPKIVRRLLADDYRGHISLESLYRAPDQSSEDSFVLSCRAFLSTVTDTNTENGEAGLC